MYITMNAKTAELVVVPMSGIGHLLPAVQLCKLILERDERISITVYIINRFVTKINTYVESQLLDNPYPTRFTLSILPTLDPPDPLTPNFFKVLFDLYKPVVKKVVQDRVKAGSPKPAGLILDMFNSTMIDIANDLDIPCYIFYTSGANFLSLVFHAQTLADHHGVDVATEFSDPGIELTTPGFKNPLTCMVIPGLLQDKVSCPVHLNHARRYREAVVKGILVNSFLELEPFPFSGLMDECRKAKVPPVYPVGPILELSSTSREGGNQDEGLILQWLDDQPKSSVLFLCFGSMGTLSGDQVWEIANGLDWSGHRFLWVLRKPPPEERARGPPSTNNEVFLDALPEGFLDRTTHRGKVIGWAPQVSVLAHPAVGGFVSHCGWNSILESLWFGVPIATWPIFAEQQLNAFELVVELGLGVDMAMQNKQNWRTGKVYNSVVTAKEIEMGIHKLMHMDGEMRERVKQMRDKSRETLRCGGSSNESLGRFIQDVINNVASSS